MPAAALQTPASESTGGRLVSTDGRALPLQQVKLAVDAKAGLARAVLTQTFTNPYAEPLRVTYLLPLPVDGAVSAFAFSIGQERIVGEVDRKSAARERFEQAMLEGRSAALVEQERPNLFTQEVGNIPPGAAVVCEIAVDQKLAWLTGGSWEWRFPTVVAPRYQGGERQASDGPRLLVDVADGPLATPVSFELAIRDALPGQATPESPSHRVVSRQSNGWRVELGAESGCALDRDLVVRWRAAEASAGVALDVGRTSAGPASSSAFGLLTVVPPTGDRPTAHAPRDVIVLLDTSGSMGGEPLSQARRVVSALVDTLGDGDRLEMVEFSSSPRRWKRHAVQATAANRQEAHRWLSKLQAGGGTEMHSGILEALAPLGGEAQRQVVLITDGLIGFESEVVGAILRRLPASSRVHVVGVGSAVNRALTACAARAGRGVELIVGLGEDPERAAAELVAHTAQPLVVNLELSGSALRGASPSRLPDLFAGSPARLALELDPRGGEVVISGRTAQGSFERRIAVPAAAPGEGSPAVSKLFARERVEDLETELAAGSPRAEIDPRIEGLGLSHQIATRLTSWVAISSQATVDPTAPGRQERMPHLLPHGMSAAGLGLRPAAAHLPGSAGGAAQQQSTRVGAPPARSIAAAPSNIPMGAPAVKATAVRGRSFAKLWKGEETEAGEEASFELAHAGKAAPRAPAEQKKQLTPPPPGAQRVGRLLSLAGGQLVFSFELLEAAGWDPSRPIVIRWSDGSTQTVTADLASTTRGGDLPAGVTVRVVVRADPLRASPAQPTGVTVELSGQPVEIALS